LSVYSSVYNSVAEIYDDLDETRARLVGAVEPLTDEQQGFRPSPERWSAAEIVEHLSIVERRVARMLGVLISKLEPESERAEGSPFEPVTITEFVERSLTEKYTAPDEIRPKGAPLSDSLARLRDSRAALRSLRERVERVDGPRARFPHPVWGPLDLYQWLAFVGAHERRHLAQIEALKEMMNHER
jgi:DinB superfamily